MKIKEIIEKFHLMGEAITGRVLIEDLTKRAVEICKDIIGADACSIFLVDDKEPDRLIMKASCGYRKDLSGEAEYRLRKDKPNEKLGVTAWIVMMGNTFQTRARREFSKCPEYSGGKYDKQLWGIEDKLKCESFFGAPLKTSNRIFGILKVESGRRNYFSKEHKYILQIIASMITSSLQNLEVIKQFHSLSEDIAEHSTDAKKLYDHFVRACVELVPAETCSIFIPNERGRLVLRGDYGHDNSLVDMENDEYTYTSGEGVTGIVFLTGKPSLVSTKREVELHPRHKGKLYPKQWKGKHDCYSWYQFPIGKHRPYLGVMKIENKLGVDGKPIKKGGFNEAEKQILEILANSVVPLIVAAEIKIREDRAVSLLAEFGYTTNIDDIFNPNLLNQIREIKIRNKELHSKIISFIEEVKHWRKAGRVNYLDIAKRHIYNIGDVLGFKTDFVQYCESLKFFEPMLYQLPGYRSHFVHQLNVFLNGYLILNWFDDNQFKKIKKIIAQKCKGSEDSIDIFKIWFITAVFHDTGYPIGKVGDLIQNSIGKIFNRTFDQIAPTVTETLSVRLFRESFRESLDLLTQHLFTWLSPSESQRKIISHEIHELFFKDLSENLIPGLLLIRAVEISNINTCMLSTAVSAIALDDEQMWDFLRQEKIKEQISYIDHPIAFLLVYCDNTQEYGRPKSVLRNQIVERKFKLPKIDKFAVTEQVISYKDDTIRCKLIYENKLDIWREKVTPILRNIRDFWKSPCDLGFIISYATEKGEFDKLDFLTVPDKSR